MPDWSAVAKGSPNREESFFLGRVVRVENRGRPGASRSDAAPLNRPLMPKSQLNFVESSTQSPVESPAFHAGPAMELPTNRLWTVDETAYFVAMSPSWVRRSDLPFVMLGGGRRYRPNDVAKFVDCRSSNSASKRRA